MPALLEDKLEVLEMAEVHWSTSTILAVFLAASLISAVFFGLGYSFGRGGTPKRTVGVGPLETAAAADIPSHSALAPALVSDRPAQKLSNQNPSRHKAAASAANLMGAAATHRSKDIAPPLPATFRRVSVIHNAHAESALTGAGTTHYMVQVGAIGDRKDAQVLVSRLRKRGFHAGIYPGKHDKYLHVQIGPFATAEKAEAMRHHVIANGYRAILKHAA